MARDRRRRSVERRLVAAAATSRRGAGSRAARAAAATLELPRTSRATPTCAAAGASRRSPARQGRTHLDDEAAFEDEYGRDPALRLQGTPFIVFPLTMISKRVERGEDVDVRELFDGAVEDLSSRQKPRPWSVERRDPASLLAASLSFGTIRIGGAVAPEPRPRTDAEPPSRAPGPRAATPANPDRP
jgi:hypothetical protein